MSKKIAVVGGGFAGLSAAAHLAKKGHEVTLLEKNNTVGGRCRQFEVDGFHFDMGPSWYWMPEVFDAYYQFFGYSTSDFYELKELSPSYRMVYPGMETLDVPANFDDLLNLFESIEPGAGAQLVKFLDAAKYKYDVGMEKMVYSPGLSVTELMSWTLMKGAFKMNLFQSHAQYVRKFFKDPRLLLLLEFPVLFLGGMPSNIPALYSLMNYAALKLGTWYPQGGMVKVAQAFEQIALKEGVEVKVNTPVLRTEVTNGKITKLVTKEGEMAYDAVVAACDYAHFEQQLLPENVRQYTAAYWDKRVLAPSCLLYFIGVSKEVANLLHHNLFFDEDLTAHAKEIYDDPSWPKKPLFYVCCPSKTDASVAPDGKENLFLLIPVASGLKDTESIRKQYLDVILERLEKYCGHSVADAIEVLETYAYKEFVEDYNALKGNAYGLANTLQQTANLKPRMMNKKIKNLVYTGQLTVPGPGVPPSIISGEVAAGLIEKYCL